MSYQVIARKWRPQAFDEVTGQEPITRTLRNAIEHNRLHHAYMFSGARGVGKTTTARLLSKALNCRRADRPTSTPCANLGEQTCASCREIAEGRSIDVLEIDAASHTGVDNVRESVINNVAIAPARDRYKVFIIDEVHMLSGAAFNALLKTLEEPPPRVVFIMATTEAHKVPDTILSRCQQFEFRTIATRAIAERLRLIADAEKLEATDEALQLIARAGEGSMRDAQSAFDQVISFSGSRITAPDVEAALGIAGPELLTRVMRAIAEQKPAEALAVVDDLVVRGHDLRNFCRDLLAHVRDLLVIKIADTDGTSNLAKRRVNLYTAAASDIEQRELTLAAREFSESDLVRFFHNLTETEKALRESVHPRYQLEVGLVKLIEMQRLAPLGQMIQRLQTLEESLLHGRNAPAGNAGGGAPSLAGGASSTSRVNSDRGSKTTSATKDRGTSARAHADNSAENDINADSVRTPETAAAQPPAQLPAQPPMQPPAQDADPIPGADPREYADVSSPLFMAASSPPSLRLVTSDGVPTSSHISHPSSEAPSVKQDRVGPRAPVSGASPDSVVERIKAALEARRRPLLLIAFESAQRITVEGDDLCIEYAPEMKHLRNSLANQESIRLLREVGREIVGRDLGVRIIVRDGSAPNDESVSKQTEVTNEKQHLREIAEKHPAVQQLLETFRAEIVDVRRIEE
ncbi:MAG: DNA polymerase III subunit gamma/tau [Pyrinomonadaceae bacterium]|nr:DNA polymerase III subunit gamma/tau [Pyrinomonadaceae bacterium]